ncbi:MAG: D-glycero-beta-D-manno-heptose 1,7-bisphosphate 7-phosphatase [Thiomicrorhabdus chilensis]|uniref:D-glycero-beta-D-manno-heptose 1,7-bisphosphate 7-phosphatase n=1 Tax=Thiomicrorhabdus chilensis TaxID=63656 RepID=UPI00299D7A5C|nr:D-glycero-beta-D-manno-heptose 1,7-bisphosphate 7-phosphatase [Thiomicrorhabdus chilensis]MDX1347151.1 D-glycero-beta-D-manno-heptose 1,7-bisphosphate 7-phosphatase [Thiomicrorhabdus chilensis]
MQQTAKQKIIVLDRDGVINEDSDAFIKSPDEWHPVPGSIEAIAKLKQAGWLVAVATNQSGVRRGYYDRATLSAMHQKLQALLGAQGAKIDWINFSPYVGGDNTPCRKPSTGMLTAIENRFGLPLQGAPMVGDTLADMRVALAKGLTPYLVRTGKGERTLESKDALLEEIPVYDNLLAAVEAILK